jgi:hypothetical protein
MAIFLSAGDSQFQQTGKGDINFFRNGFDTEVNNIFEATDKGKAGQFIYNPDSQGLDDNGGMYLVKNGRVYERTFEGYVKPEWFGVSLATTYVNETALMMKAVAYLISKGGGVLRLCNKVYFCNLAWRADDNISIQGSNAERTMIQSVNENQFAVRIDGGFLSKGSFLRDITITGQGQVNRRRHGIYFNCGSLPYLDNVAVVDCGIGICLNGTIDGHFNRPILKGNYVGVFITTVHGASATITNVVEGTDEFSLVLSDAADTHPSEHTFIAPVFFANTFHYIVDNHSTFPANANIKIFGGSMQGSACGVVVESSPGLLEQPMVWDGVWLENTSSNPQPHKFNGKTYAPRDLLMNSGQALIKGSFITKMHAGPGAIIEFDNCNFYDTYEGQLTTSGNGTFIGKGIKGYGTFLPFNFENGINTDATHMLGFYTKPKTVLSRAYSQNKRYANTFGETGANVNSWGQGTVISKVPGGVMDGTCMNVLVPTSGGGFYVDVPVKQDKIYASCFAIRSIGDGFKISHANTGNIHFGNTAFSITPEWKTIVMIGRGNGEATAGVLLTQSTGSSKEWQMSGWQILEFNNPGELNQFLASETFAI